MIVILNIKLCELIIFLFLIQVARDIYLKNMSINDKILKLQMWDQAGAEKLFFGKIALCRII